MFNLHLTERHGCYKFSRTIEHIRKCRKRNPIGVVSYVDHAGTYEGQDHHLLPDQRLGKHLLMLRMWSIQSLCTTPHGHCSFAQHNLRIIALIQQTQVSYLARLWCIISRMGCLCFSVCCLQCSHSCGLWKKQESAAIPDTHAPHSSALPTSFL